MKTNIAIIPARGGSKGIPRKNIRLLNGKPLIAYSIEAAKKSKYIDEIFVSTDDIEIKEISEKYGSKVIERPSFLALDSTPTIEVIFHSIEYLRSIDINPDVIVLLQPTSPLRDENDIDSSFELFLTNQCEAVISVCQPAHPPYLSLKIEDGCLKPLFEEKYLKTRRQDMPKTYFPNGAIYISSPSSLFKYNSVYCSKNIPYIMTYDKSIDIDNEIDFLLASLVLNELVSKR